MDVDVGERAKSSCNCRFTRMAKESVVFGSLRHLGANKKSLFHAFTELELTMRLSTLFFGIGASDG